jgi:outer membrane protein assembly factor BamD (BamD/ComL family)
MVWIKLGERFNLETLLLALCLLFTACSGDKAQELLETAEFEERQMNLPHAKQLYEEIIHSYPGSPAAKTAQSRLAQLTDKR